MQLLEGKIVAITGARRGIGLATAQLLAHHGAQVEVCDVAVPDAGVAYEDGTVFSQVDIRDAAAVDAWIDGIASRHGRLDALVNNASTNVLKDFREATDAEWDLVMGVNVKGAWYCARAAERHMAPRRRGAIVNLVSAHGMKGEANAFPYNVSKAGLVGLTTALAAELGPLGIRVNSIVPGMVRSAYTEPYLSTFRNRDEANERITNEYPLRRIGEPADIAKGVLYLVSDLSDYVSGHHLFVDGGHHSHMPNYIDMLAGKLDFQGIDQS